MIRLAMAAWAAAFLVGCGQVGRQEVTRAPDDAVGGASGLADRTYGPHDFLIGTTAVHLETIPARWRAKVAVAVQHIQLPPDKKVFAAEVGTTTGMIGPEVTFTLYEDCPDFVHRLGSYKLCRNGSLYEMNDLWQDSRDMWVPVTRPQS